MGTLTYAEIKTEVVAALGGRSNFDADRMTVIVNLAQMRISRKHRWQEMEDLVEGNFVITGVVKTDKFLSIPANTRKIYTIRLILGDGSSRRLESRTNQFFDDQIPEPEYYATGDPTIYTTFADKIEFWRVPDTADAYAIRRRKTPTAFAGDSTPGQVSDFEQKDDAIIALSSNWALQALGRMEDAGRWWTVYSNIINSAADEEVEDPDLKMMPAFEGAVRAGEYWRDPFSRGVIR